MKMRFDYDDDEVRKAFNRLIELGREPRPYLDAIGGVLRSSVVQRFEAGGPDPSGKPWTPLSPLTIARRRKGLSPTSRSKQALLLAAVRKSKGLPKPFAQILRSSGYLMNSIHAEIEGDSVVVGTNVVYAQIQQLGGKTGRKHAATIPPRPYLGVSASDKSAILEILRDRLMSAAEGR